MHARVERDAELALAQQRVVLVNADVAADAAAFADVVGGGFVIIDSKDKGDLDPADMTWHALIAACSADGVVALRVVKGSVVQKACKAEKAAIVQAGSPANYKRDVALARPDPAMVARVSERIRFGTVPMREWAAQESSLLSQLICAPVANGGGGVSTANYAGAGLLARAPVESTPAPPSRAGGLRAFLERSQQRRAASGGEGARLFTPLAAGARTAASEPRARLAASPALVPPAFVRPASPAGSAASDGSAVSAATENQIAGLMAAGLVRPIARACVGAGIATVEFLGTLTASEVTDAVDQYLEARGKPTLTALQKRALAALAASGVREQAAAGQPQPGQPPRAEPVAPAAGAAASQSQTGQPPEMGPVRQELLATLVALGEPAPDAAAPLQVLRDRIRDLE